MTEYLGDERFRLWKLSAEEGERLGISVERSPDGTVREIHRVYKADDGKSGKPLLRFRLFRSAGNPWTADFPYTDLINPETTRLFIETTYEAYRKQVGEFFGNTVKWAFDDEPLLAGGIYDFASLSLPLSRYILSEFQKRCQYDLADHLPSLFWDVGNYRKVRFDYYQTTHDLWKENYLSYLFFYGVIAITYCSPGTGWNMNGPNPWLSPADGSFYAYEHAPGIDLLRGAELRENGSDPWRLFHIKQAASVSHQLGRRTLCEAYGVAGWDSTFEHYKRVGDWLMVHGIDFMDQHLSLSTIRGARKRDHPQSFSDISAWWPYYKLHGDYLGRVSYMLSRGSPANRLLVLKPTTSGFISTYRYGLTPELQNLRSTYSELMQALADHQIDFDLGDEYLLEWFGKVEGKRLSHCKNLL